MEQRKGITLAQRIKMHPAKDPRRRVSEQDPQDKPNRGKKGARGQAEGIRSKNSTKAKVRTTRKKPGRMKQTATARLQASKRRKSGK
jgi:hypothetical protein